MQESAFGIQQFRLSFTGLVFAIKSIQGYKFVMSEKLTMLEADNAMLLKVCCVIVAFAIVGRLQVASVTSYENMNSSVCTTM